MLFKQKTAKILFFNREKKHFWKGYLTDVTRLLIDD